MYKNRTTILLGFLAAGIVFAVWFVLVNFVNVPALFIPHPALVLRTLWDTAQNGYRGGTLWLHLGTSLWRVLLGVAFAAVTAIPLGLAMGRSKFVFGLCNPILQFYRPLPPLAYYTLLILWLGIGNASKIALLYLAAFPPLALGASSAVQRVSNEALYAAQSLGASKRQILWHVIFPACMPELFTSVRIGLGFAYTTLVASEIVAAQSGIGWMVLDAANFLRSDVIFVGIILMGLTGLVLDKGIVIIEKYFVPWVGKE